MKVLFATSEYAPLVRVGEHQEGVARDVLQDRGAGGLQ